MTQGGDSKGLDTRQAVRWINAASERAIAKEDRPAFIELVETVLSSLHEGNIARDHLRCGPFREWLGLAMKEMAGG